jgi:HlyD family type I secretion membrane fusion protein
MQQLVVREGQHVQKGELLARLEDVRPRAAYEDSLTKVAQLRGTVSRLRAEVLGRELAFPAELEPYDDVRRNQRDLYERRQQVINEAVESLQRTLGLARREERIVERLLRTGDVGQTEFLRVKRQVTEIEGQIANLRNKYFQDAQADLTRAVEDLATQEQVLRERIALLEHTTLRSPTEGVIKKINVTTLGATLRPGETILEILPTDSDLIVEAKFPPAEIGALRVGMPASVKLDAWDYSIYGTLDGEIAYISPDALAETDPRSEDRYFFRVHVKLPDPSLPRPDEDRRRRPIGIKAGMTGTVDVRVDERTVLTYLAKPIVKTLVDSFRER